MVQYGVIAAFAALVFWAIEYGIIKGIVAKEGMYKSAVLILGVGSIPLIIAVVIFGFTAPSSIVIWLSIAAGILWGLGYLLDFKSMETEQVTNIEVFTEFQSVIIALFGIIALQEKASVIIIGGMVVIFIGSMMMSINRRLKFKKRLIPALLANISWAFYWVLMAVAILYYHSFALPLLIGRIIGFIFAIIVTELFLKNYKTPKYSKNVIYAIIICVVIAGLLDGFGTLAFGYVVLSNLVAVGGAIVALSPVIVAVFGKIAYKDKLTKMQIIGLVVSVIGAIALSIA